MTDAERKAFADGYRAAQHDAAYLHGAIAYEQANESMIETARRLRDEPDFLAYRVDKVRRVPAG